MSQNQSPLLSALVLLATLAGPARGGDGPPAPSFGTGDLEVVSVSDRVFFPYFSSGMSFQADQGRYATSSGALAAPLTLPDGALIERISMDACDTSASGQTALFFVVCPLDAAGFCTQWGEIYSGLTETPGCGRFDFDIPEPRQVVDNVSNSYAFFFSNDTFDGTTKWRSARVYYRLQVSPAPAAATFSDVPLGHPLHQYVEALVASGITAGCGGGSFCPNSPVTRGQMAVFLAKALGLHWAP